MILNSFRRKKKEYIYRNKQRETTPPPAFSLSLSFNNQYEEYWKKEREEKGEKEEKIAPFWKVMSLFSYGI